jgi:hypothetical protein
MATRIRLVEGDTRPRLVFTLKDKDGDVIDVSAATVKFKMRPLGSTVLKAEVICTKLSGLTGEDGTIDYTAPYNAAGVGGRIRVDWGSTDLDTAGRYEAEIEITYNDGTVQTVYETIGITIRGDMDV